MNKLLFGKDKKDGIKVWSISVLDTAPTAQIVVLHGKEDGQMQEKITVVKAGKQGRNVFEQAVSEAEGKLKKQMDKGYRETKGELEELPLLAMLAADYRKQGHRIQYPCYTSVKFDGVRALAKCIEPGVVTLESRTGQPYDVPYIAKELSLVMFPGQVFDGEIYLHGEVLQDITSAVKRTDPIAEIEKCQRKAQKAATADEINEALAELFEAKKIAEIRPNLEFHVFDRPDVSGPFIDRMYAVSLLHGVFEGYPRLKVAAYGVADCEAAMKQQHKAAVAEGYEGIMLRNSHGVYESGKRSADLQKYKEFLDTEFKILDVIEDKDGLGVFVVKNDLNDLTFTITMGSHADRLYQITHKEEFIAEWINGKFQSRYKKTLLPQFPTGQHLRACDEHGNPLD